MNNTKTDKLENTSLPKKTNMSSIINEQMELNKKYKLPFVETPENSKVGIALNVKSGLQPINGLRHSPEGETNGWYIWAGEEFSTDPDFFLPLHVSHLDELCPSVLKYLGLPPGARFLVSDDFEDVWFDSTLINL